MIILRTQLSGHYNWASPGAEQHYTGAPSRRSFDRWNGDQVLFILNAIASSDETFSTERLQKLEGNILDNLPLSAQSELSVFNWLVAEEKKDIAD